MSLFGGTGETPGVMSSSARTGIGWADDDVEVFAANVAEHEAELCRLAFRLLPGHVAPADVVAATLSEAWRALPGSTSSVAFRRWTLRVATRHCLHGTGSRPAAPTTEPVHPGADGLGAALAALPAHQRACWVLRELHGLPDVDVGEATGTPVDRVPATVSAARRRLVAGLAC